MNTDPSEPVTVVKFLPGHGFEAIPVVPDETGAELMVETSLVVEVSNVVVDLDMVEGRIDEEL